MKPFDKDYVKKSADTENQRHVHSYKKVGKSGLPLECLVPINQYQTRFEEDLIAASCIVTFNSCHANKLTIQDIRLKNGFCWSEETFRKKSKLSDCSSQNIHDWAINVIASYEPKLVVLKDVKLHYNNFSIVDWTNFFNRCFTDRFLFVSVCNVTKVSHQGIKYISWEEYGQLSKAFDFYIECQNADFYKKGLLVPVDDAAFYDYIAECWSNNRNHIRQELTKLNVDVDKALNTLKRENIVANVLIHVIYSHGTHSLLFKKLLGCKKVKKSMKKAGCINYKHYLNAYGVEPLDKVETYDSWDKLKKDSYIFS